MYVIDPEKETIVLRWVGGATVSQLDKLFAQGEQAVRRSRGGASEALAKADALYGAGKYAESIPAYREALRTLSPKSPDYARATDALLFDLQVGRQYAECLAVVRAAIPKLTQPTSAANLAATGLDCAGSLPKDAPGRGAAIAEFEPRVRAVLDDSRIPLAADDRSAMYSLLVDAREDAGDTAGAEQHWRKHLTVAGRVLLGPRAESAIVDLTNHY